MQWLPVFVVCVVGARSGELLEDALGAAHVEAARYFDAAEGVGENPSLVQGAERSVDPSVYDPTNYHAQTSPRIRRLGEGMVKAARVGDLDTVKAALEKGVPVDFQDEYGETALLKSCVKGQPHVMEHLLSIGADVTPYNVWGRPAIWACVFEGRSEMVRALLDAGASVDDAGVYKFSLLHVAAERGHVDVVELLRGRGADETVLSDKNLLWHQVARGAAAKYVDEAMVPSNAHDEL